MPDGIENIDQLADDAFRLRFRAWLDGNYPAEFRQDDRRPFRRLRGDDAKNWLRKLWQNGWRAPGWPKQHGGMQLSFRKQLIYHEELERLGVARTIDVGETQLGPILMRYGTDVQRRELLPRILSCDDLWCQGYSEPNAGSDLASLRTRAVRDGDVFIVNGHKTWTTHATEATHMFALVRTGNHARRQTGISFLLVDLRSPGVTVRPIVNLAGEEEFCEVFFDDVRVPARNLVGDVDKGWPIAKALLGYERVWIGSPAMASRAFALAERLVEATGQQDDAGVVDRMTVLAADLHDYRLLYSEICDRIATGADPGPEVSMLKIYVSELLQRIADFNVDIGGGHGAIVGDVRIGTVLTDLYWQSVVARPTSIYAGANEIQRDILAKAVLGLPSEPRAAA
ncbi:MAG: acyl-CoA dehydrogenase family protein [Burkholderiales bacterium]|nr:acyl-CoA dehydrogenase family protein [Burkholderiales bacterium]